LCVLVWHYHDDDVASGAAEVTLALSGLPDRFGQARVTHYTIDQEHSNSYTTWQKMGSPQNPTPEQYAQLERAGKLAAVNAPEIIRDAGTKGAILRFALPRQAVSLLVFEPMKT